MKPKIAVSLKFKQHSEGLKHCFLFLLFFCLFASCNSNVVYDENKTIDSKSWKADDKIFYEFDVKNTSSKYKMALNVRNTTDYPYNNIYFFMKTILPDGSITRTDTIECYLAYPDGTWKGKGSFNVKDNRFWIAKNVEFKQKGRYVFKIYQATSDSSLIGIRDIGLHIEYQD